eukprot:CFRG0940T1
MELDDGASHRRWLAEEFQFAMDRYADDVIDQDPEQGICTIDVAMGDHTLSAIITFPPEDRISAQNPPQLEFTAKTNLSVGQRAGIKQIAREVAVDELSQGRYCLLPILDKIHHTLSMYVQEDSKRVNETFQQGMKKFDSALRSSSLRSVSPDITYGLKEQDDFLSPAPERRINSNTSLTSMPSGRIRELNASVKFNKPTPSSRYKHTNLRHTTFELDSHIPFPRTAGACFGGADRLIMFNSFGTKGESSSPAVTALRPRSLDQFYDYLKHMALAPVRTPFHMPAPAEAKGGSPTHKSQDLYTPLDDEPVDDIFNLQSYFTTSKRSSGILASKRKKGIARFPIDVWVDVYNIRGLNNVSLPLAMAYRLTGLDATHLCESNAEAARIRGCLEKEEIWKLMGVAISTGLHTEISKQPIPTSAASVWRQHPLGLPLIIRCLQHLKLIRDVQSIATLIAVIETAFPSSTDTLFSFSHLYAKEIALYSEVLYKWSLLIKRAELLRSTDLKRKERNRSSGGSRASISSMSSCCQNCNNQIGGGTWGECSYCQTTTGLVCSICRLAIKGIASICLVCGHAGHTQHMTQWFQKQTKCPKGCGCTCSLAGSSTRPFR